MPALPQSYVERIAAQLGEETGAFLRSMEAPRSYGLRLHAPKLSPADDHPALRSLTAAFGLAPVPWCGTGYTYDGQARPGKHPYHHAGLYYIQEPSAMIAAELLDPKPGDVVLDLAAAPGGKTTQIAAKLQGEGLLVANEIHPGRARILSENVERLGIANAVVVQATPGELAGRLHEAFDKIMLDAPCSGEGMFRKEPEACDEWSTDAVAMCAARQRDILPDAAAMLKPGGRLVYATCTFNREENEETIAWFLAGHPAFKLVSARRMWPHRGKAKGTSPPCLKKRPGRRTSPANRKSGAPKAAERREPTPARSPRSSCTRRSPRSRCRDTRCLWQASRCCSASRCIGIRSPKTLRFRPSRSAVSGRTVPASTWATSRRADSSLPTRWRTPFARTKPR